MAHFKNRPVNGRKDPVNGRNGNSNGSNLDQHSPPEHQERPHTAHANRNHHVNNKRSRTSNNTVQHTHTANNASSYSDDNPYRFMQPTGASARNGLEGARARTKALQQTDCGALAGNSQPSRSGHPIIPGKTLEKDLDQIGSRNIGGGGDGGAARSRAGDPRGGGRGGRGGEYLHQQNRKQERRQQEQNDPLGVARQRQTGNQHVPKIKAPPPLSFMAQNNFARKNLTPSNTGNDDRRPNSNRQHDARDMLDKAARHNSEQDGNNSNNNISNKGMVSLHANIPRRRSSSISPVAGASHKQHSTSESKDGDVSEYFASVETKGKSSSKRSKNSPNTNEDVVDLCEDEVVHVDLGNQKPAPKSSRNSDQSKQSTTRYGSIHIDGTSSPSEDGGESVVRTQRDYDCEFEEPVSGSKEMAVFQSIIANDNDNDESIGSWPHSKKQDSAAAAAPDSPMASPEDHPGKALQNKQSPIGKMFGVVSAYGSSIVSSMFPPKASTGLTLSKRKNTESGEPVIPQKKPKKYGGKKGKAIDTAAAFNSYKVKQDEEYDFETIPTTRSTTRTRQSGIEATSFYGKSVTSRQTTMTEQSCPSIRRTSNRINKKGKHTPETITIDDDSETEPEPELSSPPKLPKIQFDAVRIAFGTKVFFSDCKIALNEEDTLELSFKQTQRNIPRNRRGASHTDKGSEEPQTVKFDLANDLREVKYYIAGDTSDTEEASVKSSDDLPESMSFLAMKVDVSKSSNFRYPNHYKPNGREIPKCFILVEFRSDTEFTELLQIVGTINSLSPYFDKQAQLTTKTAERYCQPFIKDSKNEARMSRNSIESPTSRKKQGFLAGKKEDDILLVYPFDGDEKLIEKAAEGLNEASEGGPYNTDSRSERVVVEAMEIDNTDPELPDTGKALSGGSDKGEAELEIKTRGRAHFLTVRVEDYERLEPGEFLNDTLIDFWMQWISRHDDGSLVHFFSSHFYSALVKDKPSGVKRWTEKKGIDIFEKKFIFMPINKTLHWSQCVVVNPGAILEHNRNLKVRFEEDQGFNPDSPFPCILFLDSLKAHQKAQVAKNVKAWLNAEWKRLGKSDDPALAPFTSHANSMTVYTPKIPYQDNSWDCGVFVCRYAYAVYLLRHRSFTYRDTNAFAEGSRGRFQELITESPEFSFAMPDIARIRLEMMTLIERLSGVYLPWKQEEYRKEKEEKAAEKEEKAAARKATILFGVANAGQNMSENESNENKTSTDSTAANESSVSATAVLSAAKADEDDNVKAVANGTIEDMDISTQSEDESSPQEKMIV